MLIYACALASQTVTRPSSAMCAASLPGVGLEHTALITWSASREAKGLPSAQQFIQPAWLGEGGQEDEGWSLVCRFDDVPLDQGNPSTAFVSFSSLMLLMSICSQEPSSACSTETATPGLPSGS